MDWLLIEIPVVDVPVILVAGLIGLWMLVRIRPTPLGSASELDEMIGRDEPLVLDFFGKL